MPGWFERLRLPLPASVRAENERQSTIKWLEDQLARERNEVARERAEIVRLREENRALLNSLLGVAGVPPVETPRANPQPISPIRRRTWPQIASTREIEAARQAQQHER